MAIIKLFSISAALAVLCTGFSYSMEQPEAVNDFVDAPAECPSFLDMTQLRYIESNGHIIVNNLPFSGDKKTLTNILPSRWQFLSNSWSYAWVDGGAKRDDATGFSVRCDYKYRTVSGRAMGAAHASFSIQHQEKSQSTSAKVSQNDYIQALKVFNLDQRASSAQAKKAFFQMAAQHHPDKGGKMENFQMYSNAYDIIKLYQEQNS